MKDPYNDNPNHILTNPIYLAIKEVYDNELKPFFDERNKAVHHFQLEAKHYWGSIEFHKEKDAYLKLNEEKHRYPDFMKKHLELMFSGFELALKLIDVLPDKLLVFIKREPISESEFKINSIKILQGEDLAHRFDLTKSFIESDVEKDISEYKKINP